MKTTKTVSATVMAIIASVGMANAGVSQPVPVVEDPATSESVWFRAAAYGWLSAMEGDVSVGPLTTPVDISISDTLDSLDMAFMGLFEVGYDRWSFAVDVIYAKFSQDIDAGGRLFDSFRYEQKQWFITPVASYRVIDTDDYMMSVYAGARITSMTVDLTGRFVDGDQLTRGVDTTWVDPLVGLRGQADFGQHWFFRYSGDIGGFGVSSDLIWSAFAGLGYNFTDSFSVVAGYRGLGIDYSKDAFTMDVVSHGPLLGLEISF